MKLPHNIGPIVIIVSREEAWLYQVLREQFAEDERVDVIIDRRFAERRLHGASPAVERRRQDRRQLDVNAALRFRGWATAPAQRDVVDSSAGRSA
jgi:hypothetical protein